MIRNWVVVLDTVEGIRLALKENLIAGELRCFRLIIAFETELALRQERQQNTSESDASRNSS
jgi:hypothetical protein